MAPPLDFAWIATDTLSNTLAAPLAERALSSLDDVHQGRVIFLHSSYLRLVNEEKLLCASHTVKVGYPIPTKSNSYSIAGWLCRTFAKQSSFYLTSTTIDLAGIA
jgi:hypothetical protein